MKKIALVFLLVVFVPSMLLAWLAVRSLRDQQLVMERQQSLLYQGVADALAKNVDDFLADQQHEFGQQVESLLATNQPSVITASFDERLRARWPLAEVGFVVTLDGQLLCPSPVTGPPAAKTFYTESCAFLGNVQPAEVYWNSARQGGSQNFDNTQKLVAGNNNNIQPPSTDLLQTEVEGRKNSYGAKSQMKNSISQEQSFTAPGNSRQQGGNQNADYSKKSGAAYNNSQFSPSSLNQNEVERLKSSYPTKSEMRNVVVQQQANAAPQTDNNSQQYSRVAPSEAEFRQLVGDSTEGSVARFLENKLHVLVWYRSPRDSHLIFGAQLSLPRLKESLLPVVQELEPALREDIAIALLDDTAKPVAVSAAGFRTNWKHPFVATEVGEALPHWEMAAYLLNPAKLAESARVLTCTLGLLIGVLSLAIGIGGWLIVSDLRRHLTLARQKTDFVSNVSHELKTPLTSIRMFSELLAEGRVTEPEKRQTYLNIITAETARLTRLINNVLDFSRMERGEKKYNFARCDLSALVRETVEIYRPHLEANGFKVELQLPDSPIMLQGDRDALAQIVVNLLSNAEKYSNGQKEILVQVEQLREPLPHVEVRILDRGPGVPRGCEAKIFEQFYRAHDSLSSGIQGSGLGLTLARQIARAHAGDVIYQPRDGGGSCFTLRLPTPPDTAN